MTSDPSIDDLVARWPALRTLFALPGPAWRLLPLPKGELLCQRTHEHFVETLHIADELHTGANRKPIEGRGNHAIVPDEFGGTLQAAIEFLQQPPRWRGER